MLTITQKISAAKKITQTEAFAQLDKAEVIMATAKLDNGHFRNPDLAAQLVADIAAETGYTRKAVANLLPDARQQAYFAPATTASVQNAMGICARGTH
ncbi:MAG: hypothetical protein CMF60_02600 [Magnetococcales bacterium]|nr:hypothetical protein [Magnetococcales bacterium]MEC8066514.1 hypothetical protein [Pseudomonadota bacterium]|tara:strand:- start:31505 stop:31798 length:294 start_codon:yes stop_codon:yes gene_type:complete